MPLLCCALYPLIYLYYGCSRFYPGPTPLWSHSEGRRRLPGSRVAATGDNPANYAWLKVLARKAADCTVSPPRETVLGYEVEYLELRADYNEDQHGWDYDLFYVRREIFYNLKDEAALAQLLQRWLPDLQQLRPLASTEHPCR